MYDVISNSNVFACKKVTFIYIYNVIYKRYDQLGHEFCYKILLPAELSGILFVLLLSSPNHDQALIVLFIITSIIKKYVFLTVGTLFWQNVQDI